MCFMLNKMRAVCQGISVTKLSCLIATKGNYKRSDSSKTLSTSVTWKAVPGPDPDPGRRRLEMKLANGP